MPEKLLQIPIFYRLEIPEELIVVCLKSILICKVILDLGWGIVLTWKTKKVKNPWESSWLCNSDRGKCNDLPNFFEPGYCPFVLSSKEHCPLSPHHMPCHRENAIRHSKYHCMEQLPPHAPDPARPRHTFASHITKCIASAKMLFFISKMTKKRVMICWLAMM